MNPPGYYQFSFGYKEDILRTVWPLNIELRTIEKLYIDTSDNTFCHCF